MVKFVYMAVDENEDVYYETASYFKDGSLIFARNEGVDFSGIRKFDLVPHGENDRLREVLEKIVSEEEFTSPEKMLYIAKDALKR